MNENNLNQTKCEKNCDTCTTLCHEKCPSCGGNAMNVPSITVLNLTNNIIDLDDSFYLCTKPRCNTVYFNEKKTIIINKDEVKTKVWYKSPYKEYIVCYCNNIMLDDIVKTVEKLNGETNIDIIINKLGKKLNFDKCMINNPTGVSCEKLIINAISYAYDIYKNKQKNGGK